MAETKSKKRDSMIDQIGQQSLQAALTPGDSAQEAQSAQKQSDAQTALALKKQTDLGRPSKYTDDLAVEICERIVCGESLNKITRDAHMPNVATVYRWLQSNETFREMYTRAREDQADTHADEIVAIADENPETVPVYDKDGNLIEVKIDTAFMAWQKNRMEARKWNAAKLKPRKYGERTILAGDAENPIEMTQRSETIDVFMQNLLLVKQSSGKK